LAPSKVINGIFHGGKIPPPESSLRFVNFACDRETSGLDSRTIFYHATVVCSRSVLSLSLSLSLSLFSHPLSLPTLLILYFKTSEARDRSCALSRFADPTDKLSISTRLVRPARKEKPRR